MKASKRKGDIEVAGLDLTALQNRRLYERKGYSRRWTDKRIGGASARHELTGEWYRRGAAESWQFRDLTNVLMNEAFGMDVEAYRRYKGLFKTAQGLRDHMTDLELALTTLGETVAFAVHRARDTREFDGLRIDARDAGRIVARTREEIERHTGEPVVRPADPVNDGQAARRPLASRTDQDI